MDDFRSIAESGPCSRAWNRREYLAKALARADGKHWDRLPNESWFRDKMHYRSLAARALTALHLWDTYAKYEAAIASDPKPASPPSPEPVGTEP